MTQTGAATAGGRDPLIRPGSAHPDSAIIEVSVARLREEIAALHGELLDTGLVVGTGGNVSARVPGADLLVTGPERLTPRDLGPEAMIVCDLDGRPVDGTPGSHRAPARDIARHAELYRAMPELGGVVHARPPYATAWSLGSEPVPCTPAAAADLGEVIPISNAAAGGPLGSDALSTLRRTSVRATLVHLKGLLAVGPDARSALDAALLVEETARVVHLARTLAPTATTL